MNRTLIYLTIAFLAGTLAGALAIGGYQQTPKTGQGAGDERAIADIKSLSQSNGEKTDLETTNAFVFDAEPETPSANSSDISSVTARLEGKLSEMTQAWTHYQSEFARLQGRVAELEQRLAAVAEPGASTDKRERPARPNTPEERRSRLVESGLEYDLAVDFLWRQDRNELDRLELRDLAIREGWFRTDRYRQEVRRLSEETPDLRAEVGDEIYDRYLFASGHDNRVQVTSVINGSPAEAAGIQPGDVVDSYGGEQIFTQAELRGATSDGELGEMVPVRLRRANGSKVQIWLPRGPLGVRMGRTRADPED